jgi:hypothetical protein
MEERRGGKRRRLGDLYADLFQFWLEVNQIPKP